MICADPEGRCTPRFGRPHFVEGVGEDFWPTTIGPDLIDRFGPISDDLKAWPPSQPGRGLVDRWFMRHGGRCSVAGRRRGTPDDLIVVLTPDSGRGFLSKVFNDDWMGGFGFLRADGPVVSDIIDRRNTDVPELLYVQPHQKVSEAVAIMRDNGVSQLPVGKGEMPLAAAEIAGSVELRLMELAFETDAVLDKTVEDVMAAPLPTIGAGQPVALRSRCSSRVSAMLYRWRPPRAVVPSTDVLNFPTPREPERWPMTFSPMPIFGFETRAIRRPALTPPAAQS